MDKELLFKSRLPEDTVEVSGLGTFRVRGLSRIEAMQVQAVTGLEAMERRMLHLGLLDPELTEAEVGQWQKASVAGEIEPVTTRITELSGMMADSVKAAIKSDGEQSESGV